MTNDTPERVVFDLDRFMARLSKQGMIAFDDVEFLAVIIDDQQRQIRAQQESASFLAARLAEVDSARLAAEECVADLLAACEAYIASIILSPSDLRRQQDALDSQVRAAIRKAKGQKL